MLASDADLVKKCLNGDNSAFNQLVCKYQQRVYALCYRTLDDADLAADATQEAFLKAYHALEHFRQDASFLSWLFKIASNTCVDMIRRIRIRRTDSLEDMIAETKEPTSSGPTPERAALKAESDRMVREAIMSIPVVHRLPLVMFYFAEMSTKEIAESLGKPEATVRSNLHYARQALRRKLEWVVTEV